MGGRGARGIKTRSFHYRTFTDLQNPMADQLSIGIMPTRPCAVRAELQCGPGDTPTTSLILILEVNVPA